MIKNVNFLLYFYVIFYIIFSFFCKNSIRCTFIERIMSKQWLDLRKINGNEKVK